MALSNSSKAGAAFFIGALQFVVGMVLAEIYYPGYNVSTNVISDLGANPYPSAAIFDSSIFMLGLLVMIGAYFLQRGYRWKPLTGALVIAGIGAAGVGIFTENSPALHGIMELLAFLFGGLGAIMSFRFQKSPMSYFSLILGAITLAALVLFLGNEYLGLGKGGMERIVTYPEVLWGIGFGSHLMGRGD